MHEPTCGPAPAYTPTTCWLCGRRAEAIGIGKFPTERHPHNDPHFLCTHCLPLVSQLKATVRFDTYESNAIDAVIEKMGPVVENNGTDLSDWSEDQVRDFVVEIILGFGDAIREQVRASGVPF